MQCAGQGAEISSGKVIIHPAQPSLAWGSLSPKTPSFQLISGDKEPLAGPYHQKSLLPGQHIAFIGEWELRYGNQPTERRPG